MVQYAVAGSGTRDVVLSNDCQDAVEAVDTVETLLNYKMIELIEASSTPPIALKNIFFSLSSWEKETEETRESQNEQITRCWTRLIASNKNRNESKCVSFRFVSSSMCYLDDQLNVTS